MKKNLIILSTLMLVSVLSNAQTTNKFPYAISQMGLQKSFYMPKAVRTHDVHFDSLSFFRDDYNDFEDPAQVKDIFYKGDTDTIDMIKGYDANWGTGDLNFVNIEKYKYYNEGDNSFIKSTYYDTDGTLESPVDENIWEFDASGKLITKTKRFYSETQQEWLNTEKVVFSYLDDGKIDKLQIKRGDGWPDVEYDKYFYNTDGTIQKIERRANAGDVLKNEREYVYDNETGLLTFLRDYIDGSSELDKEMIFKYDEAQNVIERETTTGFKYTYEYDTSIDFMDVEGPLYLYVDQEMLDLIKHPISKTTGFQYIYEEWDQWTIKEFHYNNSNPGTAVFEKEIEAFGMFPNPVTENKFRVSVDAASDLLHVNIYDIQGRKIMDRLVDNNTSIDVSDLKSGMYIVKTEVEGKIYFGKLMVK